MAERVWTATRRRAFRRLVSAVFVAWARAVVVFKQMDRAAGVRGARVMQQRYIDRCVRSGRHVQRQR